MAEGETKQKAHIKRKKCRNCGKFFTPVRSTTETACGFTCALKLAKKESQKSKKRALEFQKERIQQRKEKSLNHALHSTKKTVHEYIRQRDVGKTCITCSSILRDERNFDAGHYFHLGNNNNYSAIRFDFDNIHGQCRKCNRRNEGEHQIYTENLPKRIGYERYHNLLERAKESKQTIKKWTKSELKEIRERVKKKMQMLAKRRLV
ncbi:MAG: recombination protein NinG [Flavobacteriales bacterium]|jgi:ribosomal protein L37E|nr:recombination protein NinG [Flavobacteriales bacterium]